MHGADGEGGEGVSCAQHQMPQWKITGFLVSI